MRLHAAVPGSNSAFVRSPSPPVERPASGSCGPGPRQTSLPWRLLLAASASSSSPPPPPVYQPRSPVLEWIAGNSSMRGERPTRLPRLQGGRSIIIATSLPRGQPWAAAAATPSGECVDGRTAATGESLHRRCQYCATPPSGANNSGKGARVGWCPLTALSTGRAAPSPAPWEGAGKRRRRVPSRPRVRPKGG